MNKRIPEYLLEKRNLAGSVAFITVFSALFMKLYSPFSSTTWFSFTDANLFLMMLVFYFVSASILLLSKYILYRLSKKITISYIIYISWIMSEIVILALFYTIFTRIFIITEKELFLEIPGKAAACIFLIVSIPYTIITLYAAYVEQDRKISKIKGEDTNDNSVNEKKMITLFDNNGNLKLSLDLDTLYFVESQDNYVRIHYDSGNKISSYMLRYRTKTLEKSFEGTSLVRCHRSYIVNTSKIKLVNNNKGSIYLVLNNEDAKPIPVSKGYRKNIMNILVDKDL